MCKRVVKVFGKTMPLKNISAPQFQKLCDDISRTYGLVALSNEIGRWCVLFNYAYEAGQVEHPFRYGTFKKPSKKGPPSATPAERAERCSRLAGGSTIQTTIVREHKATMQAPQTSLRRERIG